MLKKIKHTTPSQRNLIKINNKSLKSSLLLKSKIYGLINRYLKSEIIIQSHLIKDFSIFYCNTLTREVAMQMTKSTTYFVGGSVMAHNVLSIYFIPPNFVSNTYHIYSPTGRGYGAYSCSQLIAVDALKGAQGPGFNPSLITNKDSMLDNAKIAEQFKRESNLPNLPEFFGKSKKF